MRSLLLPHFLFSGSIGTNLPAARSQKGEGCTDTGDEDGELVTACQNGDRNAFEDLVRKYQGRMINIAYRMTGDYEEACETVQETFLSAYRSIRKFRREAKFSTWLYGICLNHAKNRARQTRNRSRYEVSIPDDPPGDREDGLTPEPTAPDASVGDRIERMELQRKIQECIDGLESQYREVLVLRDIEGFSYEEIRDILGIPEGTIKSRLFRGRDALKNRLEDIIGDYR